MPQLRAGKELDKILAQMLGINWEAYSTELAEAVKALQATQPSEFTLHSENGAFEFSFSKNGKKYRALADTAPMAICAAILQSKEFGID